MTTRSRSLLAAFISALLLATAVGAASANRLGLGEAGFRIVWSPMSSVPSFGSTVRCPVTLVGSFHSRTINKTTGSLIGYVNTVTVGTCEAGTARANIETLPWHLQYSGFAGTLPSIESITHVLIRSSFEIQGEIFGLRVKCRYTPASQPAITIRESRGAVTGQRLDESVITSSETGGCPSGRLVGTGAVTTPGGARNTLTLI